MIKKIKTSDYDLELLSAYGQTLDLEEMILYIDYNYSDFLDWKRGQKGHEPKHYQLPKSREVLNDIKATYEETKDQFFPSKLVLFDVEPEEEEDWSDISLPCDSAPLIPRTDEEFHRFYADYITLPKDEMLEKYNMSPSVAGGWHGVYIKKFLIPRYGKDWKNFVPTRSDFYD